MSVYADWITEGLAKPGKTRTGLARALGVSNSAITQMLNPSSGKPRLIKAHELPVIAEYLEQPWQGEVVARRLAQVPLKGYVGAGAEMTIYSEGQGPFDMVDAPDGATEDTVAVQVRGESLGALFDRWLVFYDEVHTPPTASMLGRLCVVGLADGRVLVKQLKRGHLPDHYNLLSNVEPPIYDVLIEWAAVVRQMTPR